MTPQKKKFAVEGKKRFQLEWMKEEINEFYEAVSIGDKAEILDEAIGLIRTAQQFSESKRVMKWWFKVSPDVKMVLSSKKEYQAAFKKWKSKKAKKNQALCVTSECLSQFAGLF